MAIVPICPCINGVLDCAAIAGFDRLEYFICIRVIKVRSDAPEVTSMVHSSVPKISCLDRAISG